MLAKIGNASLLLFFVLLIALNVRLLLGVLGSGAILVAVLYFAGLFIIGWLLGGSKPEVRGVLGLATAGRNFGAALVPATSSFNDPKVTIMIVVGAVVCPIILLPRRRLGAAPDGLRPGLNALLTSPTTNHRPQRHFTHQSPMKLQDKVALITGGAQGLGKSIASRCPRGGGYRHSRHQPRHAPAAAAEIEALGRACLAVRCDVSSSASVREMFAQIADRFGTLHILVNNAALVQKGEANEAARSRFYEMVTTPIPKRSLGVTKDFTDQEWHKYWGVNVHGVFYCTREALKLMEPQKAGKIINIASVAGIGGFSAFHPSYCATKGAVLAFTRSVAVEVAAANVFVNAIAAGGILTPPMEAYLSKRSEEERNRVHQLVPLGRLGKPEEYASLAVYLASDEHYLVGQTISPNGGMVL